MNPVFDKGHVRADCPDCRAPTSFEYKGDDGKEFGTIINDEPGGGRIIYKLLRCAVCHRAGVAKISCGASFTAGQLKFFWPRGLPHQPVPKGTPKTLVLEMREAEKCMSAAAWRAGAAIFRSVLEKTLKENGYKKGSLQDKIDAAAVDGVITASRQRRAQELIRTLGNDVLHDEWREVSEDEVTQAHEYTARVIHDFYDDRETVERLLREKKRLPDP